MRKEVPPALALLVFAVFCLGSCSSFSPSQAGKAYPDDGAAPRLLRLGDPGAKGPLEVKSYLYGGKYNPRRPEYALKNLAVVTETADISAFFKGGKPRLIDQQLRNGYYNDRVQKNYWGFDENAVPLNGKVWYPVGPGPFPLVVCVHGNHDWLEASEFGYDYIGAHLASRGIIFASIDENFLNRNSDGRENDARAAMLLLHARELIRQSAHKGSPVYGLVDETRIGLMGHSRGGEAAATAAIYNELGINPDDASVTFEPRLSVKGVVSLAPVEGQYRPSQKKLMFSDADFLYLHGSADGDVDSDFAARFLNRGEPSADHFRTGFWIFGANHGYFNSTWSEGVGEMPTFAPNRLGVANQQRVCLVMVTAFFEASFGIETGYKEFLRDWRLGKTWLPTDVYSSRFRQGGDKAIADFEEDADPRTASADGWKIETSGMSLWKEALLPMNSSNSFYSPELSDRTLQTANQDTCAVFLRPGKEGGRISLSGPAIDADGIRFDIGAHGGADPFAALSGTVSIRFADGKVLERSLAECFRMVAVPNTFTVMRWDGRYYAPQTVTLALEKGSCVAGIEIRLGYVANQEWFLDRVVSYAEGSSK